jgi:hypothetical protein
MIPGPMVKDSPACEAREHLNPCFSEFLLVFSDSDGLAINLLQYIILQAICTINYRVIFLDDAMDSLNN